MHALWIPSWYPIEEDPLMGIFFREQAVALLDEGNRVGVIFPEIRPLKQFSWSLAKKNYFQQTYAREMGLSTYRLHGWNLFPKMEKLKMRVWVAAALKLANTYIYNHGKPDLIHAQGCFWGGMAARVLSKKLSIPYLVTEHQDVFLHGCIFKKDFSACWTKKYINQMLDHASGVIAVSQQLKKCLQTHMRNPLSEPVVLPNSVDTSFFNLPAKKPSERPFRFLTVASLLPIKNIELLLRAFHETFKEDPSVCLEIIGDGPERERLENLSKELRLTSSVFFLGRIHDRSQVRDAFHRAHAFVLPSNFETFGVVLIEALATGLPIIATRVGGPEDIVSEETGYLVPPGNLLELAKALLDMKLNHNQFIPEKLRAKAVNNFEKKVIAKNLSQIYAKIVRK